MSAENEESLREAACVGNLEEIDKLLKSGTNVNSINKVNGWSPLHWAAKRGHVKAVAKLLEAGADKEIENTKGEIPADMTTKNQIRTILGAQILEGGDNIEQNNSTNSKPNYLANPEFIYSKSNHMDTSKPSPMINHAERSSSGFHFQPQSITCTSENQWSPTGLAIHPDFIVLCVRLANTVNSNSDFTEVEISRNEAPSLAKLTEILCENINMGIKTEFVQKIRKLPSTVLKNDRDVLRLTDYQMLEIVLHAHVHHPIDGAVSSQERIIGAHADTRYIKEHVSKLIY